MKEVAFVIGPPNTGKSYFIAHRFPDSEVIDLYEFQQRLPDNLEGITQSYEDCRLALADALLRCDSVVLEHTLMKSPRRQPYIETVREVCGEAQEIDCYYSLPEVEDYKRYDRANLEEARVANPEGRFFPLSERELIKYLEFFDVPHDGEGFARITRIQDLQLSGLWE